MAALWLATALHAYAGIFPPEAPAPGHADLATTVRREIEGPRACGIVAERDGAIVGMVTVRPWPDEPPTGRLARLYVAPVHWGEGLGASLHDRALAEMRRLGFAGAKLWVLRANTRARRFYERRGWTPTGATKANPPTDVEDVQYRRPL